MRFSSNTILISAILFLTHAAVAQDVSAVESSALAAASSVLADNGGSVTEIDGFTVTIPSGISIPAIPTALLSDTSLIGSLVSSLTATLTGPLASEGASILGDITGGPAAASTSGATGISAATSGVSGTSAATSGVSGTSAATSGISITNAATSGASSTSAASGSSTTVSSGAMNLNAGAMGMMVSVGAGVAAGMWLL